MLTKSTTAAFAALAMVLSLTLASGAFAEQKGSGPTQGQIDCHNRAVNDYYDQVKACDQSLGDLPADNAQCKQDAYDDMRRTQRTQCGTIASIKQVQGVLGTTGGAVLDSGPGTTFTKQKLHGIGGTAGATTQ